MLLRTHVAAAMTFATLTAPQGALPYALAASVIGAIIPDLDTRFPHRAGGSPFTQSPIRHRGVTHSLAFVALTACGLSLLPYPLTIPYTAGFLLHVLLDSLTRSPVFLLWPLNFPFHPPSVLHRRGLRTGGLADNLLCLLLILTFLFSIFASAPGHLFSSFPPQRHQRAKR